MVILIDMKMEELLEKTPPNMLDKKYVRINDTKEYAFYPFFIHIYMIGDYNVHLNGALFDLCRGEDYHFFIVVSLFP